VEEDLPNISVDLLHHVVALTAARRSFRRCEYNKPSSLYPTKLTVFAMGQPDGYIVTASDETQPARYLVEEVDNLIHVYEPLNSIGASADRTAQIQDIVNKVVRVLVVSIIIFVWWTKLMSTDSN